MARPTDPEKLAALRARQAANSRAYRARKAAERQEQQTTAATTQAKPRQAPSSEAAVRRAHEQRAAAKHRRNEEIGKLTSARNPQAPIYTPRELPTAPAPIPATAARRRERIKRLREHTESQKLQNIGRSRKAYVRGLMGEYDAQGNEVVPATDVRGRSIHGNLTPDQRRRFREATAKIAGASQQTIAIYFMYEGGEGDLQSWIQQIAYPGRDDADVEDALGGIEAMAERMQTAEGLYGPKALGRRLNI